MDVYKTSDSSHLSASICVIFFSSSGKLFVLSIFSFIQSLSKIMVCVFPQVSLFNILISLKLGFIFFISSMSNIDFVSSHIHFS